MPRVGMNPNRGRTTNYRPSRVTLATITFLPEEAGYFEERFEVTRLCVESLRANTPPEYDLLVFDNGSAPKLVEYLETAYAEGKIDYLVLSRRNVGKLNALRFIFEMAPGDVVAYTDDDMFFLPGWLDAHLQILDTFPNVGLVSGFYIRSHVSYAMQSSLAFAAREDVQVRRGLLNAEEWEAHFRENTGRTLEKYQREVAGLEDIEVTYQGVTAFLSSGHHQFVAPRKVMLDALGQEWRTNLMGGMIELEEKIDAMGYLRLSTREPVTRFLGNRLDPQMAAEVRSYGLDAQPARELAEQTLPGWWIRLLQMRYIRGAIWRLYNLLFHWLETSKEAGK